MNTNDLNELDNLFDSTDLKKEESLNELFENEDNIYHLLGYDKCGIQIGEHLYVPNIKRGSKNIFLAGQYGSGKSTSFTIPNILNDLGSYIVLDQDAEVYNKTKNTLEERGYKVVKLSDGVSFLSLLKTEDDVDFICKNILDIHPWYDSYLNYDIELALLKAIVYFSIAVYDKVEEQFNNLITMLTYSQETLINAFKLLPEAHAGYQQFALIKNLPNNSFETRKGKVAAALGRYIGEEVVSVLDNNVIDYEDFYNDKRVAFFIDYDLNENNRNYARMILDFFVHVLSRKRDNKINNTYFILDGLDRIPLLTSLSESMLVAKTRSNYFSILVTSVELFQLTYKREDNIILDACDTKIYYKSNLDDNLRLFSSYFDGLLFSSDFRRIKLEENEMLVFENGLKPIKWKKTYYFNNPNWFGI